jgi:hypothetical protein
MGVSAMTRARLTAGRVQSFTCPEGKEQAFLRDSEVPGLALRVTAAGNRAYVFEGKLNRRTLRLTIGSPAHWTIEAARARARELASLVDRGVDPRTELEKQRQEAEAARTRREAAEVCALEVWHAYCHERRDVWGERHYLDHLRLAAPGGEPRKRHKGVTQPGVLYALLNQPLARLTPEAVEAWAARNAHRPTQARLGLRLLKAFLNWCRTRPDFAQVLPAENPAHSRKARETLGTPKAKNDCLQREQLAPLVRRRAPTASHGSRVPANPAADRRAPRRSAGELTWDAVDFQWLTLTIRDKVKGERVIPLTPVRCPSAGGTPTTEPMGVRIGQNRCAHQPSKSRHGARLPAGRHPTRHPARAAPFVRDALRMGGSPRGRRSPTYGPPSKRHSRTPLSRPPD